MSVITENVLLAKRTIAEAAAEAGRDASEVRLLAATKMNGPEAIREAVAAGVDICAENRVQEFLEKNAMNAYSGCDVHFIGHLQRNKVKYLVGAVSLIHSVDSESLLSEIDRRAAALGIVQDVLLEVNIGGEASKSGAAPEDLPVLLGRAGEFSHVRVTGLMTIPPAETKPGENRNYFRRMHDLDLPAESAGAGLLKQSFRHFPVFFHLRPSSCSSGSHSTPRGISYIPLFRIASHPSPVPGPLSSP